MNLRPLALASVGAIAAMLLIAAWAWVQIPAGAQVPIHWGIDGRPDGYASKEFALLFTPVLTIGLAALLYFLPRFEPRAQNIARSGPAYLQVTIAIIVLMVCLQVVVALAAVGQPLDITVVLSVAVGLLFVVIGNVLGKVRSNFLFGVRTPWTLSSDLSWNKTHRLVGRLFVILGLAVVVVGLVAGTTAFLVVLLGGIVVILAVSVVYSYRVWRSDPDRLQIGERA
jgi:uncharacterized membrane protein